MVKAAGVQRWLAAGVQRWLAADVQRVLAAGVQRVLVDGVQRAKQSPACRMVAVQAAERMKAVQAAGRRIAGLQLLRGTCLPLCSAVPGQGSFADPYQWGAARRRQSCGSTAAQSDPTHCSSQLRQGGTLARQKNLQSHLRRT